MQMQFGGRGLIASILLASLSAALLQAAQNPSGYSIATVAGNGSQGFSGDGGAAKSAQLAGPYGVAVDASGNVYFADQLNHRVRVVNASGTITTAAGNGTAGFAGDAASATSAQLNSPLGVAVDSSGNLYIADTGNNRVRKVTSGGIISTVAGNGTGGFSGDGAAATDAMLSLPVGVAVDSSGTLYIADAANYRIRRVDSSGNITTVAGNGISSFGGDGGSPLDAQINGPRGIALDKDGNLYIADTGNQRIRKVASNVITTIAGAGTSGFSGDGGSATSAQLNTPRSVAVDPEGNVYISDYISSRVRKVTPAGTIFTVAGNGQFSYTGDGGDAAKASLNLPLGLATAPGGKLYIADSSNNVIRLIQPSGSNGPPAISANGVITAGQFGGFASVAPGSWVEIYGSNLAADTRSWAKSDFTGINAPAVLSGTTVTIGGHPAAVAYVSPTQVNVQVPTDVGTGVQPVTVTTAQGASGSYTATIHSTEPGLFAPGSFHVGEVQYVAAILPDGSFAFPHDAVSGVSSRPAKPGEIVTLYGTGFGAVTPAVGSGQLAQRENTLVLPLDILIGQAPATKQYSGLSPGSVGLYQFNVVIPDGVSGTLPLTFTLGGVPGSQTLSIAVEP